MDWNSVDWERLDRFVVGEAPPDEMATLAAWVNADPELRTLASFMRAVGKPVGVEQRDWDGSSAWQQLRRRMSGPPLELLSPGSRRVAFRLGRALSAAAVLILVAASSLWFLARWRRDPNSIHDFATRRSQTAVLELPDGSRVMLGPASSLRFRDRGLLGVETPRDVYLEGEAYLEVKHDAMRPFRVHTAAGLVEDVGTEFLVSAYSDAPGMRVLVANGTVALYSAPSTARRPLLTLAHGDLAELAVNGVATVTHDVNLAPYLAWTRGDLAFDGTRLGDIVPALERWYDIDINLSDNVLAERRLTATFRRESLSQVLELLALSLDVRVQREGRTVLIMPSPSPASHP
jgi:transmembrane sensor